MEIWLAVIALVIFTLFGLAVVALQTIAASIKHGGVTIRIIQDSPNDKTPTVPNVVISKEEQDAIDKYNEEQSQFMSSIRNLQQLFITSDQMTGEDK